MSVAGVESAEVLTGPDAKAANSYEQPAVVRSQPYDGITVKNGRARCELPPLSLLAATLTVR